MTILHLEDNSTDAESARKILVEEFPGCIINRVETQESFLASLSSAAAPDLILSGFSVRGFGGLTALALARGRAPGIPFVFLSGSIGEETAIAAVRAGAYDYVLKDSIVRLAVVVRRALEDFGRRRLREQDERRLLELAGIIERCTEAIVVTDMAGRITLWNAGAARLYGIPPADAVGRLSEEVLSHTELAYASMARETSLEAGEWQRELPITTRDGRNIVVDVRVTLVRDVAGRPNARFTIATDITEKKILKEQFLRAQRAEILGMLAAGIAHDFNNILTPMDMVVGLLRQRATDPDDIELVDIFEQSIRRGVGLVRQILDFSRGSGGGLQVTKVEQLLRDVGDFVRASFPKTIVLDQPEPRNLWPVLANPTQIHQVLLNLIVNARDAMLPLGGTLLIRAENRVLDEPAALALEGSRPGEFLVLEVAATGAGMAPEVLTRIWEPFFTTKSEDKGTGLGLSTVKGIVAAHGGFAIVKTQVGRGTAFEIFLPATKTMDDAKA
jgi:PAS domain S-box-containing protein